MASELPTSVESPAPIWTPGLILAPIYLTPDNITRIKAALSPAHAVALTAWAEARSRFEPGHGWVSNPFEAMTDIMEVIDARATDARHRFGTNHAAVCFQRWAFSCWEPTGGPDDPADADHLAENFEALMEKAQQLLAGVRMNTVLFGCLAAAESLITGPVGWGRYLPPSTCHYYATWMPKPPFWAVGRSPVAERHGHRFFAGVP